MNKELFKSIVKTTKNLTLLYVEDEKEVLEVVSEMLSNMFLKVDVAQNGEEGLEQFYNNSYDLIITDIVMPKMNGIEFIERIRNTGSIVPILVLSAFNDTEYFLKTIKLGIDGYMLKPMEFDQFTKTMVNVTRRIELERANLVHQDELEAKVRIKTKALRDRCFYEFYTDLPNSIMLLEDLQIKKYSHLMLLDISRFSSVNREYGKTFANHVIVRAARMLERNAHKKSTLYKVESDRFAITVEDATKSDLVEYCEQLIAFFDANNVKIDDVQLRITFNIGVTKARSDPSQTIINCEYALEKSKRLGSRRYEIFNKETFSLGDAKEGVKQLKNAEILIMEERIVPYFQPIQDISSGRVLKYEVLARGVLDGEIVLPEKFISSIERLGLISSLTRRMINKSFEFFQDKECGFSINVTERDLLEGYLEKFLTQKLNLYKIDPSRVGFEIRESVTISENSDLIMRELARLKEMGFFLSVDDFGVENTNFSRLLETKIDYIKIDGAFIRDLKENERHKIATRAIASLAKTLGLKTIAEHVEDAQTYEILKECGVDCAQGYYLGKPSPELLD